MAYCGPRGIPLSTFLGWDPDDQDAALVWQSEEARKCPACGTHPDEWDETEGGDRAAYRAEVVVCPGCREVDAAKDRAHQTKTNAVHGAHVKLMRRVEGRDRGEPDRP